MKNDDVDDEDHSQALGMCMGGAPAGPAGHLPKSLSFIRTGSLGALQLSPLQLPDSKFLTQTQNIKQFNVHTVNCLNP